MKVLLSWLKEFAPDIEGEPDALSDRLSSLGLTVEEMTITGQGLDGVVLAKVLDLRPHPSADKIQLVDVDAGDGEALQVCCGAFNMAVGDLVPFATVGTVMPGGLEIGRRKLRGEWSNGMCCSAAELGLGDDAEGILILTGAVGDAGPGTPVNEALGLEADILWDLEVNANRPDAMSVAGVARDLAGRARGALLVPGFRGPRVRRSGDRLGQGRDPRPISLWPFLRPGPARHPYRNVAPVALQPPDRGRSAPDQQHRRHLQLRHVRARAAEPHLRPRSRSRRASPHSPGSRG